MGEYKVARVIGDRSVGRESRFMKIKSQYLVEWEPTWVDEECFILYVIERRTMGEYKVARVIGVRSVGRESRFMKIKSQLGTNLGGTKSAYVIERRTMGELRE